MKLTGSRAQIAGEVLKEIKNRLTFLLDVGLDYLTLDRAAGTLSGGEAQRIRLASQLGSELSRRAVRARRAVDRPAPARQRAADRARCTACATSATPCSSSSTTRRRSRRPTGSSTSVPAPAGTAARSIAEGTPEEIKQADDSRSPGASCRAPSASRCPTTRRKPTSWVKLTGAREHNLKNVDVRDSARRDGRGHRRVGRGQVLAGQRDAASRRSTACSTARRDASVRTTTLTGLGQVDKVIVIDQQPIGRTPRSNPATYTKAFDLIRELFAQMPEARDVRLPGRPVLVQRVGEARRRALRGVRGRRRARGRDALPAERVRHVRGLQGQALQRRDAARDVQGQEHRADPRHAVDEALELFKHHKQLGRIMQTLVDVGLGYMSLGQPATTLSGGEAQRVKLARELARVQTGPHALPARRADHRPALRRHARSCSRCSTASSTTATPCS